MGIMTNQNACGGKSLLFLVALVVLAEVRPGIAEVSDQEAERQLKAMMESASQEDLENIWTKARQGDASGQFVLAFMHEKGLWVPKDLAEAAKWYRLAAEQGLAQAQYTLGWMYDEGVGVLENYQEAAKWYRLAAEQGNAEAQNNLANLCLQSHLEGLQRELEALARGGLSLRRRGWLGCGAAEAYAWWILSAAQGSKNAAKNKDLFKQYPAFAQDVVKGQRLARKLFNRIEASKSK